MERSEEQKWYDKYTALRSAVRNTIADLENKDFSEPDNCEYDADMAEWKVSSAYRNRLLAVMELINDTYGEDI